MNSRDAALHWCQLLRQDNRREDAKTCLEESVAEWPLAGELVNEIGLIAMQEGNQEKGK